MIPDISAAREKNFKLTHYLEPTSGAMKQKRVESPNMKFLFIIGFTVLATWVIIVHPSWINLGSIESSASSQVDTMTSKVKSIHF
jgi:hypothetical protein